MSGNALKSVLGIISLKYAAILPTIFYYMQRLSPWRPRGPPQTSSCFSQLCCSLSFFSSPDVCVYALHVRVLVCSSAYVSMAVLVSDFACHCACVEFRHMPYIICPRFSFYYFYLKEKHSIILLLP